LHLHLEVFAVDRLRTAMVRLFELYAESLPEGHERTRIKRMASGMSVFQGALDAERVAACATPAFVMIDHRPLGLWTANSRDEWLEHFRVQNALAADWTLRDIDILALTADGILTRETFWGTERSAGGAFENVMLMVTLYGADGLLERAELFEPDQEIE